MAKKPKINIDRSRMSSEDINKMKNFNDMITRFKSANTFNWLKLSGWFSVILFIGIIGFFLFKSSLLNVFSHGHFLTDSLYVYHPNESLLRKENIPVQKIIVDINRDTTIATLNGAFIQIKAGTLKHPSKTHVELHLQEAYTAEQLLLNGLTTISNEGLLSSGGMFSIFPEDSLTQMSSAISISVPTETINTDMDLYLGNDSNTEGLRWKDPKKINSLVEQKQSINEGEKLFSRECKSCHTFGDNTKAPDLSGIGQHRGIEWLHGFIQCPPSLIYGHDATAACLYKEYNEVMMPAFIDKLSGKEIDKILDYCNAQKVSEKLREERRKEKDCQIKCMAYKVMYQRATDEKNRLTQRRKNYIQQNGNLVQEINRIQQVVDSIDLSPVPMQIVDNRVVPVQKKAVYYTVEINTFGWFNIDVLLHKLKNLKKFKLTVNIENAIDDLSQVFILLPEHNIHAQGGLLPSSKSFGFYYKDGTIDLPENSDVLIYAINESNDRLDFAYQIIKINGDNDLTLKLESYTKEQFNSKINNLLGENRAKVKDSRNADKIRALDTQLSDIDQILVEIEKNKPVECNCDCGHLFLGHADSTGGDFTVVIDKCFNDLYSVENY